MVDDRDVYLKEYDRLRDEIELNLKAEDSIINYAFVFLAALLASVLIPGVRGAAADPGPTRDLVLAIVPLLFTCVYVVLCRKLGNNRRITNYIVFHLRSRLEPVAGESVLQWDIHKYELDRPCPQSRPSATDRELSWPWSFVDAHYLIFAFLPVVVCGGALGVLDKLAVPIVLALAASWLVWADQGQLCRGLGTALRGYVDALEPCLRVVVAFCLLLACAVALWALGLATVLLFIAFLIGLLAHTQRMRLDQALRTKLDAERRKLTLRQRQGACYGNS